MFADHCLHERTRVTDDMATNTEAGPIDTAARYPTAGPDGASYDRYRGQWTDDELLIYDTETEGAWIQSPSGIGLDFMR